MQHTDFYTRQTKHWQQQLAKAQQASAHASNQADYDAWQKAEQQIAHARREIANYQQMQTLFNHNNASAQG